MYAVPSNAEIIATAKNLWIHIGPEEVDLYRRYLLEQLSALDQFVQARIDEPTPPLHAATRPAPVKASAAEDPLNAWLWKTAIGGSNEGLLAGKTVSYKDHVAVAGVPMSFGTFALDGFIPDFDATVVARVLQAGGQVVGKNVMDGLSGGYGMGGSIGDYGRVLNPHNPTTSPAVRPPARVPRWRLARWIFPSVATRVAQSAFPPPSAAHLA